MSFSTTKSFFNWKSTACFLFVEEVLIFTEYFPPVFSVGMPQILWPSEIAYLKNKIQISYLYNYSVHSQMDNY